MTSCLSLFSGVVAVGVLDVVERAGMGRYSLYQAKRRTMMRTLYRVDFRVIMIEINNNNLDEIATNNDDNNFETRSNNSEERKISSWRQRQRRREKETLRIRLVPDESCGNAKLLVFGKHLTNMHPTNIHQVRHGDCSAIFTNSTDGKKYQIKFRDVYRLSVFLTLLDIICYGGITSSHLDIDMANTVVSDDDEDDFPL